MNLSTLSQLPAEPLQMLGKSRRQIEEEAAAEARKNAKPAGPPPMTSAPAGYEVTAQGGLKRKDQPWIVPETKGRAVKAHDSEQAAFECWLQRECPAGDAEEVQRLWEASDDYADFHEGSQPAQPADSGEVPSVKDVSDAWDAAMCRKVSSVRAWKAVEPLVRAAKEAKFAAGHSFYVPRDTPADRRAEVIAALNAL